MEPEHSRFGGGPTETFLNPLVAVWMLVAIVLLFTLPRKRAITPFLLALLNIPLGQVLVLGGLHFTVLRILIFAGLARCASFRGPSSRGKLPGGFNKVDWVVMLWSVSAAVTFSLQWMNMQALINHLGDIVDSLGAYIVIRFLIPDLEAIRRTIKVLAVICIIQGACMINEQISHVNVFGYLGGMSLGVTVRDGKIRSEGVMGCIYAGVFAGVLIPLFFWLWTAGKSRLAALAGFAGATAMAITSNASTSIMALTGSIVGLAFWPLRKQMRLVRWGIVATLVSLHMAMKAPVWALIARIDLTGSSSGDHRKALMDNCIYHFRDWWLIGCKYYNAWGWDMWDLCNQFVAVAVTGGLLTLIFYIMIYSRSFGAIGNARKRVNGDRQQEWLLWCLGADLFANVVASFGINYVHQLLLGFFPLLACISVAAFDARETAAPRKTVTTLGELASVPGAATVSEFEEAASHRSFAAL